MTTPDNLQQAYSRKEKRVLAVALSGIGLLLGISLWRWSLEIDPQIAVPAPTLPAPNAYDFYAKAVRAYKAIDESTPQTTPVDPVVETRNIGPLSPQQAAQLYPTAAKEALIARQAEALSLLRQGFRYPYRQPPERGTSTPFTNFSGYRSLARLLIVESHARSERGDWEGACRSTLDILHLGQDVPRGGALISSLVGCAVNAIGRKELNQIVPHLNAGAARQAALQIERLEEKRFSAADMFQEEKWVGLAQLQKSMKNSNWRSNNGLFLESTEDPVAKWKTDLRLQLCSKRGVVRNYTDYMDALIERNRLTYKSALAAPALPLPSDPINEVLLPVFERARCNLARDATGNCQMATMLALRAFQLERGRYPTTLRELTPRYLKHVPIDPFGDTEPLRYENQGNTYLLYSIGPDGVDDGGRPIEAGSGSRSTRYYILPDSKGDAVAGINR